MLAGVDYLADDVLEKKGASTILFICFVGPALLLTPAWSALGTRIGKKRGYLVVVGVPRGRRPARGDRPGRRRTASSTSPSCLVGVGYAGCQVFPMAMLPDAAAVDARRTGSNRAGVYTGVWTAGETLGPGARPGRLRPGARDRRLPVVDRRRRRPAATPRSTAITLGFSMLPAALILLSLWWLRRYSLDAAEVDESVPA